MPARPRWRFAELAKPTGSTSRRLRRQGRRAVRPRSECAGCRTRDLVELALLAATEACAAKSRMAVNMPLTRSGPRLRRHRCLWSVHPGATAGGRCRGARGRASVTLKGNTLRSAVCLGYAGRTQPPEEVRWADGCASAGRSCARSRIDSGGRHGDQRADDRVQRLDHLVATSRTWRRWHRPDRLTAATSASWSPVRCSELQDARRPQARSRSGPARIVRRSSSSVIHPAWGRSP